jgi:hypothetical protein
LLKKVAVALVDWRYLKLTFLSGVKEIVLAGAATVEVGEVASILIQH